MQFFVGETFQKPTKMEQISDVYIADYTHTIYTKPATIHYIQNNKPLERGIFEERNGVLIIIYNKTRNVLVLVKQFRPSVYFSCVSVKDRRGKIDTSKYPASLGVTLEFCAGLEDKNVPSIQIAKEEVLEECGYDVPLECLEKINTFKNLTDTTSGSRTTAYYCEVTDEMRVHAGGGVDDEIIEVVEAPVREVVDYANQSVVNSPANFLYGLYWFLYNKYSA